MSETTCLAERAASAALFCVELSIDQIMVSIG
ncbi:hypothetical protein X755_14015 [Mesorhizobium sp. LNJC405B00]|nr:hypothetical protein X755_14015 [Mesorhizobium sp. LNJC405B00]ESZ64733.1 hypothetical protein X729_04510 [Mesorhizobium sp. L103C131B0]